MKYIYLIYIAILCLVLIQCKTQKSQKDIEGLTEMMYKNIPKEDTMAQEELKKFEASLTKGMKLYKVYCADCHGIFTKGKDGITNFTDEQLDDYEAASIRRDKKNHAAIMNMSAEQVSDVLSFLYFRNLYQRMEEAKDK